MAVGKHSGSARLLSKLQGVRLGSTIQMDVSSEEELAVEPGCGSEGLRSRAGDTASFKPIPAKQDVPLWRAMWDNRPAGLRLGQCDSLGDRSVLETVVNVATSMPFVAIGLQIPRRRPAARIYAGSLVGVGVASSLYHMSRGEARKLFRIGDYAMIAVASLCLNSALRDNNPRALFLGSAMLIPVQPMLVTVLHTGMMEATFAQRVANKPELKRAHNLHKLSSVVGSVLFVAEDAMPRTPYIHAAWHLAAALGLATSAKLLD